MPTQEIVVEKRKLSFVGKLGDSASDAPHPEATNKETVGLLKKGWIVVTNADLKKSFSKTDAVHFDYLRFLNIPACSFLDSYSYVVLPINDTKARAYLEANLCDIQARSRILCVYSGNKQPWVDYLGEEGVTITLNRFKDYVKGTDLTLFLMKASHNIPPPTNCCMKLFKTVEENPVVVSDAIKLLVKNI